MITLSPFDLTLGAIALTGYGCLLGYLAGVRYGRARAALRGDARRAHVYARMLPTLRSINALLVVKDLVKSETVAQVVPQPTQVIVDWALIEAAARAHGFALVPANKQSELRH